MSDARIGSLRVLGKEEHLEEINGEPWDLTRTAGEALRLI